MLMLEKLLQGLDVTVEPFALCRAGGGQRLALSKTMAATLHYVDGGTRHIVDRTRAIGRSVYGYDGDRTRRPPPQN